MRLEILVLAYLLKSSVEESNLSRINRRERNKGENKF